MYWKATDLDGFSINIAECGLCPSTGSCPQCTISNDHFLVTRSGKFSDLQIVDQDRLKDGWTITCSKKDNATQDQCNIRVKYYHMPQCQNGTLQILETQPQTPILCEGLKYLENMKWTMTDNNGSTSEIAMCLDYNRKYKCSNSTDFSASRTVTVSQLVIQNYARDKVVNKTLTCIRRDGAREDSCRIRVVYPAEITKRSVTLNGWSVTATAVIDKVYDSDKDVVCLWNMTGPNSADVIEIDRPQFSTFLESSRVYYNGNCSLSISANVTEGVYHVTVIVLPAGSPVAVGNVTLKKPGTLLRLPSCPPYIAEGTSLECPCRHALSLEGSPPATVTWLKHDVSTVLPTNHDDTSVLRVSSVGRKQNGTTYTCRSVWGPNAEVTESRDYTLLVAYGPSSATVTSQANVTEATQQMTLICTAYDVYPSANFTWSVPCLTLDLTSPVSTCTLAQETLREATEVVCLAINTAVPVLNASGVYTAPVLNKLQNKGNGDDGSLGSVVGGSITAIVVIAALVVVVVIIVFRRKGLSKPASAKHSDEFEEYINEFYESTDDVEPSNLQRQNLSEHDATHPPQSSTPYHHVEENATREDATFYINTAMVHGKPSPRNDVYDEVVKIPKVATLKTKSKETQPIQDETYAQVQKKPKGENSPTQTKSPEVVKKPKGAALKTKSKETQPIANETYAEIQRKPKGENSPTQAKSPVKKVRKEDNQKSETSKGQDVEAKGMSEREEVTEYANFPPGSTGENSDDVYMNVGQSSPLTESNKEVTKGAATDDEYNNLSFARPQPVGNDGHYDHLGGL
ncbi:uncharacterized protein [Littorina saxatilis]|uniref:uncharacterized protein isoform X2 n=1 Tax=Littorina saxatilis TaxID=31220 RepID=UPI0038B54596